MLPIQEGETMIDRLKRAIDKAESPIIKRALFAIAKLKEEQQDTALDCLQFTIIKLQINKKDKK